MTRWSAGLTCALALGVAGGAARPAAAAPDGTSIVIEAPSAEYEAQRAARGGPARAVAATAGDRLEALQRSFAEFCDGWTEKLRDRQRDNTAKIRWATAADGTVVGEYVGYDTNHMGPRSVTHPESTPIGKLTYIELRLRRSGRSKEEALAGEPVVVERTEVTELFRHDGRGWVY